MDTPIEIISLTPYELDSLTNFAASYTEPRWDHVAVVANAQVLLDWIGQAGNQDEADARYKAVTRAWLNRRKHPITNATLGTLSQLLEAAETYFSTFLYR